MKIINLKVRVKVLENQEKNAEDLLEDALYCIETPTEDDDGPLDHLAKHGYEIMIMDRDDK
jgi:hypothetical protein